MAHHELFWQSRNVNLRPWRREKVEFTVRYVPLILSTYVYVRWILSHTNCAGQREPGAIVEWSEFGRWLWTQRYIVLARGRHRSILSVHLVCIARGQHSRAREAFGRERPGTPIYQYRHWPWHNGDVGQYYPNQFLTLDLSSPHTAYAEKRKSSPSGPCRSTHICVDSAALALPVPLCQ